MKSPHLYVSQGFIVRGTPVTKEELEREAAFSGVATWH
jgi:hypothetical protein